MSQWPEAVTLEGQYVRLEPLTQDHHDDLVEATGDGELHKLWYTTVPDADGMSAEIDRRIALPNMLAFAIVERASGRAVGMTTYMNCVQKDKKLEIGSTWYRKAVQRSPLNTECKRLMLSHAFDALGCNCVEFRTHVMNVQSRRAIERLGAKLDGVLRSHMVMKNGTVRDTAAYSIIASEWPMVRAHLDYKMQSYE